MQMQTKTKQCLLILLALAILPMWIQAATVDWSQHGLSHHEQRFSSLEQVNENNIEQLGLDWYTDIPAVDDGLAATPIVQDGIIYMTSSFANVYAIDGRSGETIWHFDPGTKVHAGISNSWAARVNRGVAVADGRVFVGTPDCRLVALDAKSGDSMWETLTCNPFAEYAINGAPRVANGMVYIGNGVSDAGARGYVSAYDAASGEMIWRFYSVPGDPKSGYENKAMQMAARTWADGWAKTGGGSPWDAIVYDPELNQLYIGTDSSAPMDPSVRSPGGGDHLFTNSIVALDASTGDYKWHYQTVPNDAWDYNAANHIILADLRFAGVMRKVLMQAPKNGFFYVLDRKNGALLSAEPYINVTWASHVDLKTGRPVETAGARYYRNDSKSARLVPSLLGGHNWHPMSYSPDTGLVYFPAHEFKTTYSVNPDAALGGVMFDWYGDDLNADKTDLKEEKTGTIGRLLAWDPVKGKAKWHVDHPLPINGGVMSTAGDLVFQGTATGEFNSYSAQSGKKLWSYPVQASVQAPPITYMIDDTQYILASVGGGGIARFMVPIYGTGKKALGPSRLMAFRLGASNSLPAMSTRQLEIPRPPEQKAPAEVIARGAGVFEVAACGLCHGSTGVARRRNSSVPDLRLMSAVTHKNFKNIVLKGYRSPMGMISYEGILTEEDVDAVYAFIVDRQWQLYNKSKQ